MVQEVEYVTPGQFQEMSAPPGCMQFLTCPTLLHNYMQGVDSCYAYETTVIYLFMFCFFIHKPLYN